jgi:hypothetical protein
MAYKVVSIYKRPNKSVLWHTRVLHSQELEEQTRQMCYQIHQGQYFRTTVELDLLTLEFTQIWPSKEMYEEVKTHAARTELLKLIAEYNERMGIIKESVVEEEINFDLD